MVQNGLANVIEREEVCERVTSLALLPRVERDKRRARLVGNKPAVLYDTLSNIADDLELKKS